jgi:hypothetical protein
VIAEAANRTDPEAIVALPCLHQQALAALSELPDPRDAELVGVPGIGCQTLAAQYAAAAGMPLLAVDLRALVESGATPGPLLTRTLRQAAMTGAFAYFRNADAVPKRNGRGRARSASPICAVCAIPPANRNRSRCCRCRSRPGSPYGGR